jgi:hypothetical protein
MAEWKAEEKKGSQERERKPGKSKEDGKIKE